MSTPSTPASFDSSDGPQRLHSSPGVFLMSEIAFAMTADFAFYAAVVWWCWTFLCSARFLFSWHTCMKISGKRACISRILGQARFVFWCTIFFSSRARCSWIDQTWLWQSKKLPWRFIWVYITFVDMSLWGSRRTPWFLWRWGLFWSADIPPLTTSAQWRRPSLSQALPRQAFLTAWSGDLALHLKTIITTATTATVATVATTTTTKTTTITTNILYPLRRRCLRKATSGIARGSTASPSGILCCWPCLSLCPKSFSTAVSCSCAF